MCYISSYMTRVAKENQGLDTTFVDLENCSDEEITASFRDNTKVCNLSHWIDLQLTCQLADLD